MAAEDAVRAADIGSQGVVISNHGGRQLDGSRARCDQLDGVVQAAGDRLNVMLDMMLNGGMTRGSHVLKAPTSSDPTASAGAGTGRSAPWAGASRPPVAVPRTLVADCRPKTAQGSFKERAADLAALTASMARTPRRASPT
ncbi:alpha-hydroxy-acid oxidizing protein [Mesobaculum littorinae]|uniref:alpha-hydroxy-acid oxidizing protein n=1 Tax=Mesobaculum littorinae TaxID=2486419 RepID=UPI0022873705|nr:alpha-hydroxy-acid oxidizing protein [Mesobaculum littorinae]